jgi:hypothetical protein
MDSKQGMQAFFDGSTANFRKVLRVGEAVGPFKVTKIERKSIEVEANGKTVVVNVGQQFRKPPEATEWPLTLEDASGRTQMGRASDSRPNPTAIQSTSDVADPRLRALMERRNQSLSK